MRRDVRSQCGALLMCAVVGCVIGGCASRQSGRWIPPQEVFGFSSIQEATNTFNSYDVAVPHGLRTREVHAKNADFLFVTRIPYSSSTVLATYCYEKQEPDFWQLRALLVFTRVRSVDLDFVAEDDSARVISEGKTLFTVTSAASEHLNPPVGRFPARTLIGNVAPLGSR